jgi:hypothetical protein
MRAYQGVIVLVVQLAVCLGGCGSGPSGGGPGSSGSSGPRDRSIGQTEFESTIDPLGPQPQGPGAQNLDETVVHRLVGDRLYYLNSHRGLMVFDVATPDAPRLLGRAPMFGAPVDLIVRDGVAVVVVGDWFGRTDGGAPFHGSIVRAFDVTDPTSIRVLGEAWLDGSVREDRVVGDVIYVVSEDSGRTYGWAATGGAASPSVVVASVSFANHTVTKLASVRYPGNTGVFDATSGAILVAAAGATDDETRLVYLDVSKPDGAIVPRGSVAIGRTLGVRAELDFADGSIAHMIGHYHPRSPEDSFLPPLLMTADFSNPDAPVLASQQTLGGPTGFTRFTTPRFDAHRLYLWPGVNGDDGTGTTPFQVWDLTNPAAPRLAGTVAVPGEIWNLFWLPGSRVVSLGHDFHAGHAGDPVALQYLDVTDPASPQLLGTATFGGGWPWLPEQGMFKAFTLDDTGGLLAVAFSGWTDGSDGVQLIELSPTAVTAAGAAHLSGKVARGVFAGGRLVALSDESLGVVDATDPMAPAVAAELTLARGVIAAQPHGAAIAEVSSRSRGIFYQGMTTQVRVLPIAGAEETADTGAAVPAVDVEGSAWATFGNGALSYIVSDVYTSIPCPGLDSCPGRVQQVQVVDWSTGSPVLRGEIALPTAPWASDIQHDAVQVGSDVLAFARWDPAIDSNGQYLVDATSRLFVVDLADPDAPRIASVAIQTDPYAWWGNLRVVGGKLYAAHYDRVRRPDDTLSWVKYYLDAIDLGDRSAPRVSASVNVPGLLVGADPGDPSLVYTIDVRGVANDTDLHGFDVLRISGSQAVLVSHTMLGSEVGSAVVRGTRAYVVSLQATAPAFDLHAIDVDDPSSPRDRIVSEHGWGQLRAIEDDRAFVTSGWGGQRLDIYQLHDGTAPSFEQTIPDVSEIARQDQVLFLSIGPWGVHEVQLP